MREALLPSLERQAPDVERKLESMLDSIIVRLDLQ
jgi:hypothetical protein